MLAKMIDKIVSLKETKIFEIDGQTYADASLTRIPPHVDRPDCISVSGLDSICKLIRTELEKVGTTIMVQVKSNDTVEVMTTYLSDFSRNTLYRAKADAPGLYTGFRGREVALIELRSLCIPNEGTAYLLDLLSRMTNENSVSTNDNGVTQTVEARQGVALNAVVEIKPRVMLRPFRTFLEVEQPESEFLLRVDPDEGIGFFEADGGIWKLEAKKNIADYFLKNMGDLIDAGKVVVMQQMERRAGSGLLGFSERSSCKIKRAQADCEVTAAIGNVIEEMADVQIMLDQLRIIFHRSTEEVEEAKLERLKNRLDGRNNWRDSSLHKWIENQFSAGGDGHE